METMEASHLKPQRTPQSSTPTWRFLLPLAFQLAIVLIIPFQKAVTLNTGTTVYLRTVPVDPYDVLRGRYVTLNYEIAQRSTLEHLPGWSELFGQPGEDLFITLEAPPESGVASRPWQAVAVSATYPTPLDPHQQVIKGRWATWNRLDLGLGAYYIPEEIGDDLENDIRQHRQDTRIEAKVDARGNAALVKVWVEDRHY